MIHPFCKLPALYEFIRPHQSYLVNNNKIVSCKKEDGGYLYMEDNTIGPVSCQQKYLIRELF